jgi:hypothetical protein
VGYRNSAVIRENVLKGPPEDNNKGNNRGKGSLAEKVKGTWL